MKIGWKKILAVVGGSVILAGVGYLLVLFDLTDKGGNMIENKPNTAEVSVADWKTYRNEELGFEFKYPKEWFLEENLDRFSVITNEIGVNADDRPSFTVYIRKNENLGLLSVEDLVEKQRIETRERSGLDYDLFGVFATTTISGNLAIGRGPADCLYCHNSFTVVLGKDVYSLVYDSYSDGTSEKIFKTFRFVEKSRLSSREQVVYRNDEYGFRFEYPLAWGLAFLDGAFSSSSDEYVHRYVVTPEVGGIFTIRFEDNSRCHIDSVSTDFQYPSEVPLLYGPWKWVEGIVTESNLKSDNSLKVYLKEIRPGDYDQNSMLDNVGYFIGDVEKSFFVRGRNFPRLLIGCSGGEVGASVSNEDRAGINTILSTFRFLIP